MDLERYSMNPLLASQSFKDGNIGSFLFAIGKELHEASHFLARVQHTITPLKQSFPEVSSTALILEKKDTEGENLSQSEKRTHSECCLQQKEWRQQQQREVSPGAALHQLKDISNFVQTMQTEIEAIIMQNKEGGMEGGGRIRLLKLLKVQQDRRLDFTTPAANRTIVGPSAITKVTKTRT